MNYEIIEHRYEVLAHAIVAGYDRYDVAVVLRQYHYGTATTDAYLPVLLDTQDHEIWQGGLTRYRRSAIRELNELVSRLDCTPRGVRQRPVTIGWLGRHHSNDTTVGGVCVCGMVCEVTTGQPLRYAGAEDRSGFVSRLAGRASALALNP